MDCTYVFVLISYFYFFILFNFCVMGLYEQVKSYFCIVQKIALIPQQHKSVFPFFTF